MGVSFYNSSNRVVIPVGRIELPRLSVAITGTNQYVLFGLILICFLFLQPCQSCYQSKENRTPTLAPALYFFFCPLSNSFSKVNKINAFLETPNLCASFSNLLANSSEILKVKRLFLCVTISSHPFVKIISLRHNLVNYASLFFLSYFKWYYYCDTFFVSGGLNHV